MGGRRTGEKEKAKEGSEAERRPREEKKRRRRGKRHGEEAREATRVSSVQPVAQRQGSISSAASGTKTKEGSDLTATRTVTSRQPAERQRDLTVKHARNVKRQQTRSIECRSDPSATFRCPCSSHSPPPSLSPTPRARPEKVCQVAPLLCRARRQEHLHGLGAHQPHHAQHRVVPVQGGGRDGPLHAGASIKCAIQAFGGAWRPCAWSATTSAPPHAMPARQQVLHLDEARMAAIDTIFDVKEPECV